jgi:hypothetical protein
VAAAFVIASIVALSGCIACPEGALCNSCNASLPHGLSFDIPWYGDEHSQMECGSACEPADGEQTTCDECVSQEGAVADTAEESLYAQAVDRLVVQPASMIVFSTVSLAGTAFGTVANYFVPEAVLGPPDSVPPGRFHPVPTRPVFAHRG